MRTFEESVKSQKTIESMIKNPEKSNKKSVNQKQSTPAPVMQEDEEEDMIDDDQFEVDRQIQANREKMMSKKKKASTGGVKSPKASKAGGKASKNPTTWDKTVFGGSVKSEDVKSLDRSAPTSGRTNGSLDDDHQRSQYVPDE